MDDCTRFLHAFPHHTSAKLRPYALRILLLLKLLHDGDKVPETLCVQAYIDELPAIVLALHDVKQVQ